jgi:hypothetical protein
MDYKLSGKTLTLTTGVVTYKYTKLNNSTKLNSSTGEVELVPLKEWTPSKK